jgi:hypothetical protein
VQEISVFDDSGSTHLDLFIDDCYRFGLHPDNASPSIDAGFQQLITANGFIMVGKIESQFIADDTITLLWSRPPFLMSAMEMSERSADFDQDGSADSLPSRKIRLYYYLYSEEYAKKFSTASLLFKCI